MSVLNYLDAELDIDEQEIKYFHETSRINLVKLNRSIATFTQFTLCSIFGFLVHGLTFGAENVGEAWLAGDHHIHSQFSVGWDRDFAPPSPIIGGDAIYPIQVNALKAKYYGLSWMVSTDHGGPLHSRVNRDLAYPQLLKSRQAVPEVVQFYGMEFDTPGADHSSLIVPFSDREAEHLFTIESSWAKRERWPANPSWDSEVRMLEALVAMGSTQLKPVLIANHPSRSAPDLGKLGLDEPNELRSWNETAPEIAVGMAGAPGHQAATLNAFGGTNARGARGGYGRYPTLGGFDQLTAVVGGFWDDMIGEGRNWWITANSDSHVHFSEGGSDFWPGEYSKTYVWAHKNHDSILESIRSGRIFVTTGDLINGITTELISNMGNKVVFPGDQIDISNEDHLCLLVTISYPGHANYNGDIVSINRVDVIAGLINEDQALMDLVSPNANSSTSVIKRFQSGDWKEENNSISFEIDLPIDKRADMYVRFRGTNTSELEPTPDARGEDPWKDLWFYTNPIRFITH